VHLKYPELVKIYSIGINSMGKDILVVELGRSDKVGIKVKPTVSLTTSIFGSESVGREILIKLVLYLVQNYNQENEIRSVICDF